MRYIHFIVNPLSGNGKHSITAEFIAQHFPAGDYRTEVSHTKYKGHAVALTKMAVALNAGCIVACGGDGTINEVASCIVGTNITLGVIPVGSGNGLASHLQIPKDINTAMAIIKSGTATRIDAGCINGHYFFSNTGIGIDAAIIKKYEQYQGRTLWAYIRAALGTSFTFRPRRAVVYCNGQILPVTPFLLLVSNSNEMGYNMGLTPDASLTDGLLDIVVVPKLHFFDKLLLGYYVLKNQADDFKKARRLRTAKLSIDLPEHIFTDIQIDGEYHNLKTNRLEIKVLEKGLEVFAGIKNS